MDPLPKEAQAVGPTRFVETISLGVLCALIFVWPIGHTVALRNILIGTDMVLFGALVWRDRRWTWSPELTRVSLLLALFTSWAIMGAFFFAIDQGMTLKEIRGQWLMSLVVFSLGILAASASRGSQILASGRLLGALWLATMAHIVAVDVLGIREWMTSHQMPHRLRGLTPGAPSMSYLMTPFACLLATDLYGRVSLRKRLFPVAGALLALSILMTLAAMYLTGVRNGTISFLVVVAALSILYCVESKGRFRGWIIAGHVMAVMLAVGGIAYFSVRKDSRWEKFFGTLPLAWDTEHHKAWLDPRKYPYPRLPDGRPVDDSAHDRIAWFKVGSLLVRDHPWGAGFGRHVFGQAVSAKYGESPLGEAHSGLLDVAIGTGIPGLLMWLLFLGYSARIGWRAYRRAGNLLGLCLAVYVLASFLRLMVDSVQRDHMLQEMMFLIGLLLVLSLSSSSPGTRPHCPDGALD